MRNEEDRIRELFQGYNPPLGDKREFMRSLEKRMDAAEIIRRYHQDEVKRCRTVAIIAGVSGMALGAVVVSMSMLFPVSLPQLHLLSQFRFSTALAQYQNALWILLAAVVIAIITTALKHISEEA